MENAQENKQYMVILFYSIKLSIHIQGNFSQAAGTQD